MACHRDTTANRKGTVSHPRVIAACQEGILTIYTIVANHNQRTTYLIRRNKPTDPYTKRASGIPPITNGYHSVSLSTFGPFNDISAGLSGTLNGNLKFHLIPLNGTKDPRYHSNNHSDTIQIPLVIIPLGPFKYHSMVSMYFNVIFVFVSLLMAPPQFLCVICLTTDSLYKYLVSFFTCLCNFVFVIVIKIIRLSINLSNSGLSSSELQTCEVHVKARYGYLYATVSVTVLSRFLVFSRNI